MDDELAEELKREAAERGQSVNALATAGLRALVDPEFAGDEADRLRARLSRAGLLAVVPPSAGYPPEEKTLSRAREAAGQGRSLSDYVSDARGER